MIEFTGTLIVKGVLYAECRRLRPEAQWEKPGKQDWEPDCLQWPLDEAQKKLKGARKPATDRACMAWGDQQFKAYQKAVK